MLYMPEDISSGFKANWDGKNMSNLATDSLRAAGRTGTLNKLGGALEGAGNLVDKAGCTSGCCSNSSCYIKNSRRLLYRMMIFLVVYLEQS